MRRIDIAFEGLQPVAVEDAFLQMPMGGVRLEELVVRKQRRLAAAHIGEDQPAALDARVSWMANLVLVTAVRRLRRHLQAAAVHIIEPAVVEAAQPAVLDAPVTQVRAAVRAQEAKEAGPPGIVAKQHQVLAEEPRRHRRAVGRQLVAEPNRMPVAAHHGAARRAGSRSA